MSSPHVSPCICTLPLLLVHLHLFVVINYPNIIYFYCLCIFLSKLKGTKELGSAFGMLTAPSSSTDIHSAVISRESWITHTFSTSTITVLIRSIAIGAQLWATHQLNIFTSSQFTLIVSFISCILSERISSTSAHLTSGISG